MTYCIGMSLNEGILIASDSRTNAGVDHIAEFPKMTVFEVKGERRLVLVTSGNLATSQAVISELKLAIDRNAAHGGSQTTLLNVGTMFEAAELVGSVLYRISNKFQGNHVGGHSVNFTSSFLLAGEIAGQMPALYNIYPEGNFIQSVEQTPFFQIGEIKYGKPILDRVITYQTSLLDALKCALISYDSTIRANLSVGLPIDMCLIYKNNFDSIHRMRFGASDPYLQQIRERWGIGLREVFNGMPNYEF